MVLVPLIYFFSFEKFDLSFDKLKNYFHITFFSLSFILLICFLCVEFFDNHKLFFEYLKINGYMGQIGPGRYMINLPTTILLYPLITFYIFHHKKINKFLLLIIFFFLILDLYLINSKAALIFLMINFFLILNSFWRLILLMVTTLLLFFILIFFENYNMTDQIYSFSIKIEQFKILYPIFIENFLFGAGIGFSFTESTFGYLRDYLGYNYYENHLMYILTQYGIIGFILLLMLFYFLPIIAKDSKFSLNKLIILSSCLILLGTNPYLTGFSTVIVFSLFAILFRNSPNI